tara:strand:- start:5262 stop:5810 length:549 start_codon:yes stop_codon:yes gene_type:complete
MSNRFKSHRGLSKTYPISLCCANTIHDRNLGSLIRSAACFGAECVHIIGPIPERKVLNSLSGSLYDFVKIKQHRSSHEFLDWIKNENIKLVAAEICEDSEPVGSYNFNFDRNMCLVVGNAECGIPIEILQNSDKIHIPMPGIGHCLNTSQAANILLYEAVKHHEAQEERIQGWADQGIYCLP